MTPRRFHMGFTARGVRHGGLVRPTKAAGEMDRRLREPYMSYMSRILLHRSVCAARKEAAHRRRATFQCGQSIGEVGVRMGSRTGGRLRSGYGVREETAVRRKRCFAEHEPCFLVRVRFEVGNTS